MAEKSIVHTTRGVVASCHQSLSNIVERKGQRDARVGLQTVFILEVDENVSVPAGGGGIPDCRNKVHETISIGYFTSASSHRKI